MNSSRPARTLPSWFMTIGSWRLWVLLGTALRAVTVRRRRVPVMLQLSAVECGATCLAMVLTYYGRKTSVSECREFCGIGRDGLTARSIAQAARNYGLRVRAFSLEPADFPFLDRVRRHDAAVIRQRASADPDGFPWL